MVYSDVLFRITAQLCLTWLLNDLSVGAGVRIQRSAGDGFLYYIGRLHVPSHAGRMA
jgi:hypothetical protein